MPSPTPSAAAAPATGGPEAGAGTAAWPEPTLPPEEEAWLRAAYEEAGVILEYGSGASTVMAAGMDGKTVFAVESSKKWAERMRDHFAAEPPRSNVEIVPIYVGPVKKWGMPRDDSHFHRWPRYPLKIWDRLDDCQPDVVFVDGRFRVACVLATLYRTRKPVSLYFDDYTERPPYHVIEEFVPVAETRGRMARFEIEPAAVPPERLMQIMALFTKKL